MTNLKTVKAIGLTAHQVWQMTAREAVE